MPPTLAPGPPRERQPRRPAEHWHPGGADSDSGPPGGGRKRTADLDPRLRPALLALVEPQERGDPMSPLRWTTKSTRNLADELTRQGHKVSADTVGGHAAAGGGVQPAGQRQDH